MADERPRVTLSAANQIAAEIFEKMKEEHEANFRFWYTFLSEDLDRHSVSFSDMSAEAETEMAEWDAILHPRKNNGNSL